MSNVSSQLSLLEKLSTAALLVSFLTRFESFQLYGCSRCLRKILGPIFVPLVVWRAAFLNLLCHDTHRFVQKLSYGSISDLDPIPSFSGLTSLRITVHPVVSSVLPSSLTELELGTDIPCVLPSGLTSLKLSDYFDRPLLGEAALPSSLVTLVFGWDFNQPLYSNVLPSGLQSLQFGRFFDQPLGCNVLPSGLTRLKFKGGYNVALEVGVLPTSLRYLSLGYRFDHSLGGGILPSNLTCLKLKNSTFRHRFEKGDLPMSLTRLTFDCPLPIGKGVLPSGLKSLSFYGKELRAEEELPNGLTELVGRRIFGTLPLGLSRLRIIDASGLWEGPLPRTLIEFELTDYYGHLRFLPPGLQRLKMSVMHPDSSEGDLPVGLTSLHLVKFDFQLRPATLPSSLIDLHLNQEDYEWQIGVLPSKLYRLTCCSYRHVLHPRVFPESLRELTLADFDHPLNHILPKNLELLVLRNFDQPLEVGVLPQSLRELRLHSFNQPLRAHTLPPNLTVLTLGSFHQSLPILPSSLTYVEFGRFFNQPLEGVLPNGLVRLGLMGYKGSLACVPLGTVVN